MELITLFATIINIIIFITVVELTRRNRLKERYSLLWLFSSFVMIWFSVSRESLHLLSRVIGIQYPPSLIFLLGFLFLIIINISELSDQNKTLTQEIALLQETVKSRRGEGGK